MWGWGLAGSGSMLRRPVALFASALVVVAISVGCVELMQRDERVRPGMMRKAQTFEYMSVVGQFGSLLSRHARP